MFKFQSKGFTLIELLVTIGIIGILASISVSVFQEYKYKASQAKTEIALNDLITAAEVIYDEDFQDDTTTAARNLNVNKSFGQTSATSTGNVTGGVESFKELIPGLMSDPDFFFGVLLFKSSTFQEFKRIQVSNCKNGPGGSGANATANTVRSIFSQRNNNSYIKESRTVSNTGCN